MNKNDLVEAALKMEELTYYARWGYDGYGTPGPKLPWHPGSLITFAVYGAAAKRDRYYTPGNPMRNLKGRK